MLEQKFRSNYQKYCVDPLAKQIEGITSPLVITCMAGSIGVLCLPALYYHKIYLSIILLFVSGYLDTLDGTLARLQQKSSPFGTLLDLLTDRLVETFFIIGLYLQDPTFIRGLLLLGIFSAILFCVCSFLTVGIFQENYSQKSFYYSPGLIERMEAFIFFSLLATFPSFFEIIAQLFIGLLLLTTGIRIVEFWHLSNHR